MALKIFISSVSGEFDDERQALHAEIQKLQDLFVGMEFFGSDSNKPADYCVQQVEQSDLYVGLFGENYGSIDKETGKSFTQREYEAAKGRIPCLIYFKGNISDGAGTHPGLASLKRELRERHIVYPFKDLEDLRLQFLRDFIKLLRADLFEKVVPVKRGDIPADALVSLTKSFIREQIRSVGQDKYISDVYVPRAAEKDIARFTGFEATFRANVTTLLDQLHFISQAYPLGSEAALAVSNARISLIENIGNDGAQSAIDELKRSFFFREVDNAIEEVNSLILEPSEQRSILGVRAFQARVAGKPFIDQSELSDFFKGISIERFRSAENNRLETDSSYRSLLKLFPAYQGEKDVRLANDLIKELAQQTQLSLKRCLVLVDKAGTGKTNIACRLAEQLAEEHPVVLLSGQMELSSEYDIEFHIEQKLESAFSGIFADWMNRVSPGLRQAGKWLFIIIDGINENSKRTLLINLLKGLLPRLESKRIKLVLTCRDLFWDVFRDTVGPYLFEEVVPLHEFSEPEWQEAVTAYFKKFDVECTLDKDAREALRNPLLLRFFCEAHRDQRLGRVSDLRLVSVFDLYVARTGQDIAERHASLTTESLLNFLIDVAHQMWNERSISVNARAIGINREALSESSSVYNLVLSENIILEENSHSYSTRKSVRFMYDEFMEYMIARSWVNEISSTDESAATSKLLQQAVEALGTFPPVLGAVLFLDKMLGRSGRVVNEFIKHASKASDAILNSQQTSLVYAFESLNFSTVDDDLISAVRTFESKVREELKDRVARVLLNILEAQPDHPYAREYAQQVLEVGAVKSESGTKAIPTLSFPTPVKPNPSAAQSGTQRLPPARYHYSEETKINAIGILVQMKDVKNDYALIDEGIKKLGQTELHMALQALEYLDVANDELVYKTVASYLKMSQPEYRIYCAWLLRERSGREAAGYLLRLLLDSETRVHKYTVNLFERRLIEGELIEAILAKLVGVEHIQPWHLSHLIRTLGKTSSFVSPDLIDLYGSRIVSSLTQLLNHSHTSIRLEVYRAILAYPSFLNAQVLRRSIEKETDPYIVALANKLPTQPTASPAN